MGRPPALPPEKKALIVLDILAGQASLIQAARDVGVSPAAVANWKRRFLDAGTGGLAGEPGAGEAGKLAKLQTANAQLRAALGEAEVLARVWRISALARQAPSQALPQAEPRSPGQKSAQVRPRRSDAR